MQASTLHVRGLRLVVHLGWGDEERRHPQPIDLDLRIQFAERPPACESDELSGTVCYDKLCEKIRGHCSSKPFRLIERMAFEIHELLSKDLPPGSQLCVKVTKLKLPIEGLTGGVSFTYGTE